jgi:hypothetical protein
MPFTLSLTSKSTYVREDDNADPVIEARYETSSLSLKYKIKIKTKINK